MTSQTAAATSSPSPPAMETMSLDIDRIVRDYMTTLTAKDEDILKIYEDNQRMRDLCADSLRAREELEAQLASQRLLAETLRTELHEKQQLILAQDAEARALRHGSAALRVALGTDGTAGATSSADLRPTLDDIAHDVRELTRERNAWEDAARYWSSTAADLSDCCEQLLMDEERRTRRQIEDAARSPVVGPLGSLHRSLLRTTTHLETEVIAEKAAAHEALTHMESRHRQEEQHAALLRDRAARLLTDTVGQLACSTRSAEVRELIDGEQLYRQQHALERTASLVDALTVRAAEAEAAWHQCGRKLVDTDATLSDCKVRLASETAALSDARNVAIRDRDTIAKLRRQHNKDARLRDELAAKSASLQTCTDEVDALKEKHAALCQRLVAQRHQSSMALADARTAHTGMQARILELERQKARVEERVRVLEEELKARARRTQALERKVEEITAEAAVAAAATVKERQAAAEAQRMGAACRAVEEREAAARASLTYEEQADRFIIVSTMHGAAQSRQKDINTREVAGLAQEIQEWVRLVSDLREELRAAHQQARVEAEARALLEEQQRAESAVLERLARATPSTSSVGNVAHQQQSHQQQQSSVMEPSPASAVYTYDAGGAGVADVAALQQRIRVLEQACRRSAAVITELRESQHARSLVTAAATTPPTSVRAGVGDHASRIAAGVMRLSSPWRDPLPRDPFFGTNSSLSAIIADMDREE